MIRVLYNGKSVLIASSRQSAQEYIDRHSATMQPRFDIKETRK